MFLGRLYIVLKTSKKAERCSAGASAGDGKPAVRLHVTRCQPPSPTSRTATGAELLDFDLGADVFELLLDGRGLVLRHGLLDGLRGTFHEVLGFLEAQARDLADDLDDVDLVAADFGERHRELGLLFGSGRRA